MRSPRVPIEAPVPPVHPGANASASQLAAFNASITSYNARLQVYARALRRRGAEDAAPEAVTEPTEAAPAPAPAETPTAPAAPVVAFRGTSFPMPDAGRLSLAVNLANSAIANGVSAGDYRWHGGATDYEIKNAAGFGVKMDAQDVIEFARAVLAG